MSVLFFALKKKKWRHIDSKSLSTFEDSFGVVR